MRLIFAALLALALAGPATAQPVIREIDAHLAELARAEDFSGAVLIEKDGRQVFARAYGLADRGAQVENTLDTRFNLASMGKMFTAMAVMQLVEAGRIDLDARVGVYLPDLPNAAVRDRVTVHQLLTHTSGMGSFWADVEGQSPARWRTLDDYLPLLADRPLEFEPGERMQYSNNGYVVLGLIVQAVSGEDYFDYVRRHVFAPCGMDGADFLELDVPAARFAVGYARDRDRPGRLSSNVYAMPVRGGAAGGAYASARDMAAFARCLADHRALGPEATALMTEGKVDFGARRYAYGFTDEQVGGRRVLGHSGGHVGIAGELLILPDDGWTIVILTNGDVENFWDAQTFVKRRLVGETPAAAGWDFTRALMTAPPHAAEALLAGDHPPVRTGLLEEMGHKRLWQGRVEEAAALFRLHVMAAPDDAWGWLGLGQALAAAGDRAGAAAAWTRYLELEPEDQDVRARLTALDARPHFPPPAEAR